MGYKKRFVVKKKQANKRRQRRRKMADAGKNPDDYFSNGVRVKFD